MRISDHHLARLSSICKIKQDGWGTTGKILSEQEMIQLYSDVDGLLVEHEPITENLIRNFPNLKLIGCARGNPVNVDIPAATRRKIPVLNAPGRNANASAEFTIGLILSEARHIARGYHALKSGRYTSEQSPNSLSAGPDVVWNLSGKSSYKDFQGAELRGSSIGILGLGNVGLRVAQLAQAFGMIVFAYSPGFSEQKASAMGVSLVPLDQLLSSCDFVTIHCAVNDQSKSLLGKRELSLMKPTAYLINASRAVIIDQEALIEVLTAHRIAGAALDVFWYEPLSAYHPLLQLDNVTLTPHLAGAAHSVIPNHSELIVDGVIHWMHGQQPAHIRNPEVLGSFLI